MTHDQWQLLTIFTDLGDSAVTASLTCALALYLLLTGHKRTALLITLAYLGTALFITLGKVWLYSGCPNDVAADLKSPSGHAALSFAAYGMTTIIIATGLHGRIKQIALAIGFGIPVMIAVSRVLLHFHTISDVFIGACIGWLACITMWKLMPRGEHVRFNWKIILPGALLVILALHGIRFPGEEAINHISDYVQKTLHIC